MKLFSVRISFLQPVELNGYIEGEDIESVRQNVLDKGKEQGHLDLKILDLEEVQVPEEQEAKEPTKVLN